MKMDQLSYFVEAARYEHIGKAARAVAISPSAISHSIRALEEELGCSLFEKVGRSIQLTEHGRRLLARAEKLLGEVQAIREDLRSDEAAWDGHYRMGATHGLGERIFMPWWNRI